ncbi:TetR/AcrR family transcriptional regulator [Phenylobacterium sp.]|uniref:TetR/AcrR family transcriptional regulator n=1 Tax=Phenylobacterium sp. TaxID=1871053 RepID=UPI003566641A
MPRLWNDTIGAHRLAVVDAIVESTAALLAEHGPRAVTMSQIAEQAGIGRATLYKYFPDVEAILAAWHQRHVAGHLEHLAKLRGQPGPAGERLAAVLETYALISHHRGRHGAELDTLLHRGEAFARAQEQLLDVFESLLVEVAATGEVRDDVAPAELARYCLHALGAASDLPSKTAVGRLVTVTLSGLRPPR